MISAPGSCVGCVQIAREAQNFIRCVFSVASAMYQTLLWACTSVSSTLVKSSLENLKEEH
jgi:hypothetical protein